MTENPAGFSGDIPKNYDRDLGQIIFAGYAADMAQRAASGATASRVLETAAGSGVLTRALRDAFPAGARLTVTDLNPDMLAVARAKFRPEEQVVFQQADATELPFPAESFDMVISQFGVMFYPDKDKGYREVKRVLTRGGRYLFSVWDAQNYNRYGHIVHEVIGSFFPTDPPGFFAVPYSYHLIDPIKESLISAGFEKIAISVVQQRRTVADWSAFAHGFVFGTPAFDQIRQRGSADPSSVQQAVAAALQREFGGEPGTISIQAIMFETHKA